MNWADRENAEFGICLRDSKLRIYIIVDDFFIGWRIIIICSIKLRNIIIILSALICHHMAICTLLMTSLYLKYHNVWGLYTVRFLNSATVTRGCGLWAGPLASPGLMLIQFPLLCYKLSFIQLRYFLCPSTTYETDIGTKSVHVW